MGDATESLTPPPTAPTASSSAAGAASASSIPASARAMPVREDCWSEDATATLIEAWGRRYVELNRGNLRQKDWQEVADAVNALHGLTKKTYRTDVQCKNRIDTIKKKYKVEKAKVSASNGASTSSWTFFDRLDTLIGPNLLKKPSPPSLSPSPPVAVPLLPYRKAIVALPQKRSAPQPAARVADDSFFRRNYSAMAAAAAAAEAADDDDDDLENEDEPEEEEEMEQEEDEERERERESEDDCGGVDRDGEGMRKLARAITRFGQVYEKVEAEKLRQMVELEKQRMQFAKDLEVQRMRMFMDTQVQLERIKRGKRSASNDIYG